MTKPSSKAKIAPPARSNKQDQLIRLMRRPRGASMAEMTNATGWQAHSVRSAISASLRKRLGLAIASERKNGVRRYRIAG